MTKAPEDPQDLRLVVILLRALRFWDRAKLLAESGLSRNTLEAYELGHRSPTRRSLERIAGAVCFPAALLDPLISLAHSLRVVAEQGQVTAETLTALGHEALVASKEWTALVSSAVALFFAQEGDAAVAGNDPGKRLAVRPARLT
jgi:transcriptional regulator with XRE-family HTH domain